MSEFSGNNFYVVSGPNKHHILPRPGWPEILEHVINDCYEADVYDSEGRHITSYVMEGGHLTVVKEPLWPENTPRVSGKEYSVEYIYDNGESERDYGGKSLDEAWDDVEYMIENYDNLVSWKIHGPDDEVVFQGNEFSGKDCCDEFSGSDSPVGISGHENAVRNFRQLRSYISANQAGEVQLLIAWEKLTQRLIQ